uniref:Bifunctional lysine-specific demethylase and histidyl-hydroxylase n=1 Tax=Glossina brevipalpis TaxID=37001 RepID=A0A1A9X4M9_9MUSC
MSDMEEPISAFAAYNISKQKTKTLQKFKNGKNSLKKTLGGKIKKVAHVQPLVHSQAKRGALRKKLQNFSTSKKNIGSVVMIEEDLDNEGAEEYSLVNGGRNLNKVKKIKKLKSFPLKQLEKEEENYLEEGYNEKCSGEEEEPSLNGRNNKVVLARGNMACDHIKADVTKVALVNGSTNNTSIPSKKIRKGALKPNSKKTGASSRRHSLRVITKKTSVKLVPLSPPSNTIRTNSIVEGKRTFEWLLNPVKVEDFFAKYWESKSCFVKRQQNNYFSHLISFEAIDQMLLQNHLEFTKNVDVTHYENDKRDTLNPDGRALPPNVWDHYSQGCSIRLLNPQTYLPNLYTLNTALQEYFHCLVGANAYLTPPNSQGFAPHYDDIEAFVLQIEGRKRWKLYKPRQSEEILARFSSGNFSQEEIGKPIFEKVLQPGDVLYFPRGTIHQAKTEPGFHSLHITLSVYQKQSYADLLEKMVPLMLEKAIKNNVDLRRGLPLDSWHLAGIAHNSHGSKERLCLEKKIKQLLNECMKGVNLTDVMDSAFDQLAKKYQREALPPEILAAEKLRTVFGSRTCTDERGECLCDYEIEERTNVRLLRANILRLVEEEGKMRIYYYSDNSKVYCEYESTFIEIKDSQAASIEVLIKSYPEYVSVSQLPMEQSEEKINLTQALWERGLLMFEKPFH